MPAARPLRAWTARHPLVCFFFLAYLFAWLAFVPLALSQTGLGWLPFPMPMQWTVVGTLGPLLAALLTQWLVSGNARAFSLVPALPSTLMGAAIGIAMVVLVYTIAPSLWLAKTGSGSLNWAALTSVGVFNYSTILGGPLFEEPGWRGFALPRLQQRYGPIVGTIILVVLWSAWHLPLFLIPAWSSATPLHYLLIVAGLGAIMTLAANLSRFSVVCAILIHAAFNTSPRWLGLMVQPLQLPDGTDVVFMLAVCGVVAACGIAVPALFFTKTRAKRVW